MKILIIEKLIKVSNKRLQKINNNCPIYLIKIIEIRILEKIPISNKNMKKNEVYRKPYMKSLKSQVKIEIKVIILLFLFLKNIVNLFLCIL